MLIIILSFFQISFANTLQPARRPLENQYRVYLADHDNRAKRFMVEMQISRNSRGFDMFESYLKDGIKLDDNGNPQVGVIIGNVIPAKVTKYHHFKFRFDTKSVRWNDFATETCDGTLNDVEARLPEWLAKKQFCPWTTRSMVVRIVKNNRILWDRPN
jgi:hypothetical protein